MGYNVDAGAWDLQFVEDLDGFELDNAGTAQPGKRDVLRQLSVRPCGRPERRGRAMAVKRNRQIQPGDAAKEFVARQVEDFAFP